MMYSPTNGFNSMVLSHWDELERYLEWDKYLKPDDFVRVDSGNLHLASVIAVARYIDHQLASCKCR